ncbi:hypothetical protein MCOR27_009900 [Pyricularia oryzae]|uniref:C2H2-type domain-containing protein n=1 Tax=Pyricularia grisea TaxID=148305 RepID=A0ABQ8N7G7_PYRGI|nr:hypothetical protein MCOR01_011138 [Pyricularia oryzae]KAI6292515.1 hypothetical protein MCOR33_009819 [Pyricularia grisea]KAI6252184.1 hypothetical protein MCOR19_011190 [Pyricularia oryzae]KAI6269094.1 hypothetical protein MCOR27_009900 [Pyricularia oryzae]KAI6278101.1 hypothetical protein MCOR26_004817 [Pyricularia oryzae]
MNGNESGANGALDAPESGFMFGSNADMAHRRNNSHVSEHSLMGPTDDASMNNLMWMTEEMQRQMTPANQGEFSTAASMQSPMPWNFDDSIQFDFNDLGSMAPGSHQPQYHQNAGMTTGPSAYTTGSSSITTPRSAAHMSPALTASRRGSSISTAGMMQTSMCSSPCELGDECDRADKCSMNDECDGLDCDLTETCDLEACGMDGHCDDMNCDQQDHCSAPDCSEALTCDEAQAALALCYVTQSHDQVSQLPNQAYQVQFRGYPQQIQQQQSPDYAYYGNQAYGQQSQQAQIHQQQLQHQQRREQSRIQHQQTRQRDLQCLQEQHRFSEDYRKLYEGELRRIQQQGQSHHSSSQVPENVIGAAAISSLQNINFVNLETHQRQSTAQPNHVFQHILEYHRDPQKSSCQGPCIVDEPGNFMFCPFSCVTEHPQLHNIGITDTTLPQPFFDELFPGLANIPDSMKSCHGQGYASAEQLISHMHACHNTILSQYLQGNTTPLLTHSQDPSQIQQYSPTSSSNVAQYMQFQNLPEPIVAHGSSPITTTQNLQANVMTLTPPLTDQSISSPKDGNQIAESNQEQPSNPNTCLWLDDMGIPCGHIFEDASQLNRHVIEDHLRYLQKEDNEYLCRWMGCKRQCKTEKRGFPQKSKIERHLQTHTGDRPFSCPHCPDMFSAKQALEQHILIHKQEKPLKCTFPGCNKSFRQQSARTMHMRVHTKERPLKCNLCDRTFSESSNLAKHRRTHAAEGSFHCDFPGCKKTFHRQDQLRRHLKTHAKKVARQASVSQASVSVSPRPSEEPEPEPESEMQP